MRSNASTKAWLPVLGISLAAMLLFVAACGNATSGDSTFTSPPKPTSPPITGGPFVQVIDPSLCGDEDAPEATSVVSGDSTFVSPPPRHYPTLKDRERSRTGMSDKDVNCIARLAREALPREAVKVLYEPDDSVRSSGEESRQISDFRFTMVSVEKGIGPTVVFSYVWDVPPGEPPSYECPEDRCHWWRVRVSHDGVATPSGEGGAPLP